MVFQQKPFGKNRFHLLTDWPGNDLAGQFWQMESALLKTALNIVDSGFQGLRFQIPIVIRSPDSKESKFHKQEAKISRDSGIIWITLQKRIEKIEYGTETLL